MRFARFARLTLVVFCTALLLAALPVRAQEGGEFCVRAFEDRNGNGVQDVSAGEPVLTRGVSATLLDANGVAIATAMIDDNEQTGRLGILCFQNLAPQQYTLLVTSAEFEATTADNMTVNVLQSQRTVMEFGAQRIEASSGPVTGTTDSAETDDEALRERALISAGGAAAAMCVTLLIGLFLYLLFFRGRRPQQPMYGYGPPPYEQFRRPAPPSTGSMRPVQMPPTYTQETQVDRTPTPNSTPAVPDNPASDDEPDWSFE